MIINAKNVIDDIPVARESKPSSQFKAFTIPTIQITVIIKLKISKFSINKLKFGNREKEIFSILIPLLQMNIEKDIWNNNLIRGETIKISSRNPIRKKDKEPIKKISPKGFSGRYSLKKKFVEIIEIK